MYRMSKSFLFIVIFSITNISFADYQEGIDYKIVNEGKSNFVKGIDNEIKIIEAFWYGCPHCYKFEKYLEKWKPSLQKDVSFSKVPAAFNKYWALHAKVFYSIEKYKDKDKIHNLIFKAIHEQNRNLDNYQSVEAFLKAQNINTSKLNKNFNSDKINEKLVDAYYLLDSFEIESVPCIIVNQKYKISGRMAKTYQGLLDITDFLVKKERELKAVN